MKIQYFLLVLLGCGVTAQADKGDTFYIDARGRFYVESVRYVNQGLEELQAGHIGAAKQCFDNAIKADKGNWAAHLDRALVFYHTGQMPLALQDCDTASRLRPDFHRTFIVRADVYRRMGRCREALNDLNRIVSFNANIETEALALSRRGVLRATCQDPGVRDPKLALADATRACSLVAWSKAIYKVNLAIVYAANGDHENAVRYDQEAINSGRLSDDELLETKKGLARYEQHKSQ